MRRRAEAPPAAATRVSATRRRPAPAPEAVSWNRAAVSARPDPQGVRPGADVELGRPQMRMPAPRTELTPRQAPGRSPSAAASSAWIANSRVSSTVTPNSVGSSSPPSTTSASARRPRPARLDQRALDRVRVARVARAMSRRKRAPKATWRCSSRATSEPLDEAGQRALPLVVVDDEVLAGEGEHALDHHVVERHRLDERLEVLGLVAPAGGPASAASRRTARRTRGSGARTSRASRPSGRRLSTPTSE